ncbi:MAG: radical SAM protein [Spirochaetes bacterium]|nr:radical SAM protein [Spirochaetota bacterium]
MQCEICEFKCNISESGTGKCGMYEGSNGTIQEKYPDMYLVSVPAPIEAMPMVHYYPNSKFLQVCTIGCNFRCTGCVSWLLTESKESIEGAVKSLKPEEIIIKAKDLECIGIMFCFNEPAVSFHTFKKLAKLARENNLLIGCATNAYFSEKSFIELLEHIDFINIGIKGHSDDAYKIHGAMTYEPIFRNLELSAKSNVHTEVAAVYIKGMEDELIKTAKHIASISKSIPLQVMRFLPFCDTDYNDEPSIKDAESLCRELRTILESVYLFNSPGTEYLNSNCPECGTPLIKRGFNGPMCSNVIDYKQEAKCECGYSLSYTGNICKENGLEPLGYFGGYKNIMSLENIRTILAFLGEHDSKIISGVLHEIIKTDYIKDLYSKTKKPESYLDTIDHYAKLAGRENEANELRNFIETNINSISDTVKDKDRPRVYFALNHPLIAVFGDKFECNLVEIAGGYCVNKDINREEIPGIMIPVDLLNQLNPEIILVYGSHGYPASDVYQFYIENGVEAEAVKNNKIFNIHPYHTAGSPDWILGLMYIANIIHPEIFNFDLTMIADQFYNRIFGIDYSVLNHSRNFDVIRLEKIIARQNNQDTFDGNSNK